MKTFNQFITLLLCLLLYIPATFAQRETQAKTTNSQDVTIIIQQDQVRFTSQKPIQMMQLQILNQSGEKVYDSGPMTVAEINWTLQTANGETLKSGLYAYSLTIHESGAATARVRRGHFIVDRAQDRDGKTDKLWVTSQQDSGIGTELTVAQNEDSTVAGTSTTSDRASATERDTTQREVAGRTEMKTPSANDQPKLEAASGTIGQIAKFTSGTDLGNSVMTELNGGIGIGTNVRSGYRLQVDGNSLISLANGGEVQFGNPSTETGMTILRGAGRADLRFDGSTLKLLAGAAGGPPSSASGVVINTSGNVGIGTANPTSRLEIAAQDGLKINGYQPFLTLQDSSAGGRRGYIQSANGNIIFIPHSIVGKGTGMLIRDPANAGSRVEISGQDALNMIGYQPFLTLTDSGAGYARGAIQQSGGGLNLLTNSFLSGANSLAYLRLDNNGNVGLGTVTPQAKLDVAGRTRTQSLEITGGADFAENFDVSAVSNNAAELKIEAGMVVAIDPINSGKLTLSTQAYNRRVAGIISGAGGVNPGMRMSQAGTLADGQHPVALSGRVYCWVDASQGAIKSGDLLTTSTTPGHAMKVTNRTKAQGAILGKAMTSLKEGKGLVLVLVTLQ